MQPPGQPLPVVEELDVVVELVVIEPVDVVDVDVAVELVLVPELLRPVVVPELAGLEAVPLVADIAPPIEAVVDVAPAPPPP